MIYYWTTTNAQFAFFTDENKNYTDKELYDLAAESRKTWIEKGLKEGITTRYKRRLEEIYIIDLKTNTKTKIYPK